jgi:hypothetical protein
VRLWATPERGLPTLLALALVACGARSGLGVPDGDVSTPTVADAGSPDAGPLEPLCIEAPVTAGAVTAELEVPASLAVVDLLFLIDNTGSMRDEIDDVRQGLQEVVVPGVRATIPDPWFGVALYGEFPIAPHGDPPVLPYALLAPLTDEVPQVEAALDQADDFDWGNDDEPEAGVEALFQATTGRGYDGSSVNIPPLAGCPRGGLGGACFRADALPIIVMITDAPFHNGPPGVRPVDDYGFSPAPASYDDAVDGVAALDALLLGLGSEDRGRRFSPRAHMTQLLRDTGSVDLGGDPLYFDIGASGDRVRNQVGLQIVQAVEQVAAGVALDVRGQVEDAPGDEVDASPLLRGLRGVRASPASNVDAIEGDTFLGVVPGTVLTFEVVVDASGLAPSPSRRVFPIRVIVRAGRSRLATFERVVVVPGEDGRGCDDGGT